MKSASGWTYSPKEQADLFANIFASIFKIVRREVNEHGVEWPRRVSNGLCDHVPPLYPSRPSRLIAAQVRTDWQLAYLKCALANCVSRLPKFIRRIVAHGFCLTSWIIHWPMPLFNRMLVSDPRNYRAINLTTQVFKTVERCLYPWIAPCLERIVFGDAQFAYRKQNGARDAVLY